MTLTNDTPAQQMLVDINELFTQYDSDYSNPRVITTSNGRTYTVTNMLQNKEGVLAPAPCRMRGMFFCEHCKGTDPWTETGKTFPGSTWTQFSRNNNDVLLHSKDVHLLQTHPDKMPENTMEKATKVFLDQQ
ncbi:MAG: hypothetical protein H7A37_03720 [Chlamydiales bacterium]|nr:hypothetical protein [Chlamydiia bacterium]MCP5507394.1 hypothetical protein [Chlamydiales bacterium]